MSWLRTAFFISTPEPDAYYTAVDPLSFYEWRYNHVIPKGTLFTRHLPPSDLFTEGKIIASSTIPVQSLSKKCEGTYQLRDDSNLDIISKIGNVPAPKELLNKYHNLIHSFDVGLKLFKEDSLTRLYFTGGQDQNYLFKIANYTEQDVTLHNFGLVSDLIEKFSEIRDLLSKDSKNKKGRSYEMENFTRFNNVMTFANNSHLHVDASKMNRLIQTSGIKYQYKKTSSWKECYMQLSEGAVELSKQIEKYKSHGWVQKAIEQYN